MSEIPTCPWCDKPRATPADYDRYEGGQGSHLCWADPRCEMDGDEEIVVKLRSALAAAEARCASLERQRSGFDCRFAGPYAEMSGSHCPSGKPCQRCELEAAEARAEKAISDTVQEFTRRRAAEARVAELESERDSLRAQLAEVASAGVEFDDERLDYVVVQIDRETWDTVRALAPAPRPATPDGGREK